MEPPASMSPAPQSPAPLSAAPAVGSLEDLAALAARSLDGGTRAHRQGDADGALTALRRSHDMARLLADRAPGRTDALRIQADALCRLADVQLERGLAEEARTGLDAAEALYSRLGADPTCIADVRARRGVANSYLGRGLSALVDVQSAVLTHVQTLDAETPDDSQAGLAAALAAAAVVQARHGSSQLALAAAQQAAALLSRLHAERGGSFGDGAADGATNGAGPGRHRGVGVPVRTDLVRALQVEIRTLRALDRSAEIDAPSAALAAVAGPDAARAVVAEPVETPRLGLTYAVMHELVAPQTRAAVHEMLADPLDGVSIPGFLVAPDRLLDVAREGAATALALASYDPRLALAAGRDAACLYACAEELGLIEHPWPQVRMELARWLWLLSELGWLAATTGDVVLARDLADHAQHPLVRAESGRHLPATIARSLADSGSRLRQLRRAVG